MTKNPDHPRVEQPQARQTSTPVKTELRLDVPIMFEITAEDLRLAKPYDDCQGCIIFTALTRLGFPVFSVGPDSVTFDPTGSCFNWVIFRCDDISASLIGANSNYKPDVVGRQIILYPAR